MPWHIKLNISDWLCFFFYCEYDLLCSYNIIHITLLYMDVNRKKNINIYVTSTIYENYRQACILH